MAVAPTGKSGASGKAPAPTVVGPARPEPTSPAPGPTRPAWLVPVALAVVAIVVGGAIGLLVAGGGDDSTTATADTATGDPSDYGGDGATATGDENGDPDDDLDSGADGEGPSETTEPAPQPEEPAVRSGTLYSNLAKLRRGPHISEPEIAELRREGAPLQIIGRHQNGWYEVRMDGYQGWIFGAFVNPPPAGHRIIEAYSGNIVLRNSAGVPLGITNESGPKALATGSAGNLWRVILPDASTAFVSRNDVFVAYG